MIRKGAIDRETLLSEVSRRARRAGEERGSRPQPLPLDPRLRTDMPKILLVEDNDDNWDMLSRRLSRRGYEVERAADGQEAVDKAAPASTWC